MVCKADYNFENYLYPFGSRTYHSKDSSGKTASMSQFSFESQYYDNFLVEETYIGMGMKSATTYYRYHIKDNAVVSDIQIYQNVITGSTKYQDNITIFAFPINGKPYKWTEINRGDKNLCTSEYVYIMASGKYLKAIKITRDNNFTIGKEKHRVVEKTYWIEGYGRIITFVNRDGTERVSSKLDTYGTYLFENVSEISEERYIAHMEYLKEMEAFNKATTPQSFFIKYPTYYEGVLNLIEEQINTLDTVCYGTMLKVTIASSNNISIQDDIFSSSPQIDKSIKEYLAKLLEEKKIILETAINPETKQVVDVPLILVVSTQPKMSTQSFNVDYIKKKWTVDGQTPYVEELIKAAENYRLENKKAKKQRIQISILSYNGKSYFKGIKSILVRKD